MTTAFWCVLVVILMPIILAFIGDYFRVKQFGTFDNNNPRAQTVALEGGGAGARTYAAQANAWEAVAMFVPTVLIAHLVGVPADTMATASMVFVVARFLHGAFYIVDMSTPRSLSFMVGLACCLWMFYAAAQI